MTQFLREFFAAADRGYSRQEIKEVLRAQPSFKPMIERPRSGHVGAIKSLLRRREIVDLGGMLYRRIGPPPRFSSDRGNRVKGEVD
jgi:hypothetical protein